MMDQQPLDPSTVLARLSRLNRLLYMALEVAIPEAKAYFGTRNKPIDRWLFPALIRYQVKQYFAEQGYNAREGGGTFEQVDVPNNGLWLAVDEYLIRILKAYQGGIPAPHSPAAEAFFSQQLPLGLTSLDGTPINPTAHNLIITWDVDENYNLKRVRVAFPESGSPSWIADVPHPAQTISPDLPTVAEPAEDLPIHRDEEEETGTDGSE